MRILINHKKDTEHFKIALKFMTDVLSEKIGCVIEVRSIEDADGDSRSTQVIIEPKVGQGEPKGEGDLDCEKDPGGEGDPECAAEPTVEAGQAAADESAKRYADLNREERRMLKSIYRRQLRREAKKRGPQLLVDFAEMAKSLTDQLNATDYVTSLKAVFDNYLPGLLEALDAMEDPRSSHTHSLAAISLSRILMAVMMCGSMRDWDNYYTESGVVKCVGVLLGREASSLPTWNTINSVLERLDPKQIDGAITAACQTLMRIPELQESKIFGCWQVIIDGTVRTRSDKRMSPFDLTREHKNMYGETTSVDYYSYTVEMKLVVLGKVISLGSVAIENTVCDLELDKRLADYQEAKKRRILDEIEAAQHAQPKRRRAKRDIQLDQDEKARMSTLRNELKARREAMPVKDRAAQKILDEAEIKSQKEFGRRLIKEICDLELKDQEFEEKAAERQKRLSELNNLRGKAREEAALKLEADSCEALSKELESEKKQKCELSGMETLLNSLAERFPGESFCVTMDALYASKNALALLEAGGFKYLIRLQNKKIPCITQAIMAAKAHPETAGGRHFYERIEEFPCVEYAYAPGIKYCGHAMCGLYMYNLLKVSFPFMFITNLSILSQEDAVLACMAGRDRWLIENCGFRFQKQMMHMTHAFSKNGQAMKNHYLLIQIAHAVCQFLEASCAVFREEGKEECGMKRFLQSLTKGLIKNTKMTYNAALIKIDAKLSYVIPMNSAASAADVCCSVKMAS
jgi:hypothetical protein